MLYYVRKLDAAIGSMAGTDYLQPGVDDLKKAQRRCGTCTGTRPLNLCTRPARVLLSRFRRLPCGSGSATDWRRATARFADLAGGLCVPTKSLLSQPRCCSAPHPNLPLPTKAALVTGAVGGAVAGAVVGGPVGAVVGGVGGAAIGNSMTNHRTAIIAATLITPIIITYDQYSGTRSLPDRAKAHQAA